MTPAEAVELVKALAPVCKEQGIKRIVVSGVELEFGGGRIDPEEAKAFQEQLDRSMPTDDEMLYWSVMGKKQKTDEAG